MNRFIAIPVPVGDSFYLERENFSVLVDGGKKRKGYSFQESFISATDKKEIDIVVCTHEDSDHVDGLIELFEGNRIKCKEVWLPGEWLDCVVEMLESEDAVIRKIILGANRYFVENRFNSFAKIPKFNEIGNLIHEKQVVNNEDSSNRSKNPSIENLGKELGNPETERKILLQQNKELLGERISQYDCREDLDFARHSSKIFNYSVRYCSKLIENFYSEWIPFSTCDFWGFVKLVEEAVKTANNIRKIAVSAYNKKIPVRWLRYNTRNPTGKIYNNLWALNAEQSDVPLPTNKDENLSLFENLSLSPINKRSLVFYSPADNVSPGVLFCADSNLKDVTLPLKPNDLITVPHHGSKHNVDAYDVIATGLTHNHQSLFNENLGSLVWVRSDSKSGNKRPCDEYKQIQGQKFCTNCSTEQNQTVILEGNYGYWKKSSNTRNCVCK